MKELVFSAWEGILRNKLLAVGLFLTVFLLSLFFIGVRSVSIIIDQQVSDLSKNVDLTLFLKKDIAIDHPLIRSLTTELTAKQVEVTVLSPEMALERLKQGGGMDELIDETLAFVSDYRGESFFEPIMILRNFSGTTSMDVSTIIEKEDYAAIVDSTYTTAQLERINNFSSFATVAKGVFVIMLFFFLVVAALMVYNTTRLLVYSRQKEIEVMDLVGASKLVLEGPFYLENLLVTCCAILASVILSAIFVVQWNVLVAFNAGSAPEIITNMTSLIHFLTAYLSSWWALELLLIVVLFGAASAMSTYVALKAHMPRA